VSNTVLANQLGDMPLEGSVRKSGRSAAIRSNIGPMPPCNLYGSTIPSPTTQSSTIASFSAAVIAEPFTPESTT
jgi:hypothetical protein